MEDTAWMNLAYAVLETCTKEKNGFSEDQDLDYTDFCTRDNENAVMTRSHLIDKVIRKNQRACIGEKIRTQIQDQLLEEADLIKKSTEMHLKYNKCEQASTTSPTTSTLSSWSDNLETPKIPDMHGIVVVPYDESDNTSITPQKLRRPKLLSRSSCAWASPIGLPSQYSAN